MVTRQTAIRLKNAGFPQPAPAMGQIWFDPFGDARFVRGRGCAFTLFNLNTGVVNLLLDGSTFWDEAVFAPTVTDILPLLPTTYRIGAGGGDFVVWEMVDEDTDYASVFHNNADEAAALAWLDINE